MSTPANDDASAEPEGGPSRSDLTLIGRAIRQRWPMSEEVRIRIRERLFGIVDSDDWDTSPRDVIAASKVLLDADKLNMEQEKRDQAIPDRVIHEHRFANLTDSELVARAAELARRAGVSGPTAAP